MLFILSGKKKYPNTKLHTTFSLPLTSLPTPKLCVFGKNLKIQEVMCIRNLNSHSKLTKILSWMRNHQDCITSCETLNTANQKRSVTPGEVPWQSSLALTLMFRLLDELQDPSSRFDRIV